MINTNTTEIFEITTSAKLTLPQACWMLISAIETRKMFENKIIRLTCESTLSSKMNLLQTCLGALCPSPF